MRLLVIRRVVGDSMLPSLAPGQIVIGLSFLSAKPGQLVIINHKGREIVKRLAKTKGDKLYITGDNQSHSTDSRQFGWLDSSSLLATVIWPKN